MKTMQHNNADKFAHFLASVLLKQLPINQYKDLKQSKFFRWAILSRWKYATKLLAVWIGGFLVAMVVLGSLSVHHDIMSAVYGGATVEKIAVLLSLTKLYIAWCRIHLHPIAQEIDYKIYDSIEDNVWCKPKLILSKDLLIDRFQVRPILQRIKQTIFLFYFCFLVSTIRATLNFYLIKSNINNGT